MINGNSLEKKIQNLRQKFYKLNDGKSELLKLISESEVSEQVYNSNAIENSTLTLEETDKILMQINLDRYINERELFEAKNLAKVVEYINNNAVSKPLDFEMILFLHGVLLSNINDNIAGRFRQKEWVRTGSYVALPPDEVIPAMTKLLSEYNASTDPIATKIAKFHLGFEYIHPFVDGNGRIGRALNNYLLIREGYVPMIINYSDRPQYYDSFKEFQTTKKCSIMQELVGKSLINSYHKRLAYLSSFRIMKLSEYAKAKNMSLSALINKANRHTIPAFRDKGVWMIGEPSDAVTLTLT